VHGDDAPPEPSGGLLQRLKLVLDGLAAIGGADPDVEGGAFGGGGGADRHADQRLMDRRAVNENGWFSIRPAG